MFAGIGWTSFAITRVEKYSPDTSEESTPWIKTTAGIVTVSVLSAAVFVLAVIGCVYLAYKMRNPDL